MSINLTALPGIGHAADLFADGYAILRGAADPGLIAEIEADLAERFEATPF